MVGNIFQTWPMVYLIFLTCLFSFAPLVFFFVNCLGWCLEKCTLPRRKYYILKTKPSFGTIHGNNFWHAWSTWWQIKMTMKICHCTGRIFWYLVHLFLTICVVISLLLNQNARLGSDSVFVMLSVSSVTHRVPNPEGGLCIRKLTVDLKYLVRSLWREFIQLRIWLQSSVEKNESCSQN